MNDEPSASKLGAEIPNRMSSDAVRASMKRVKVPTKVYSVPRRFGIGTIMGVAVACALFVSTMQMMGAPPLAIGIVATFLFIVGACQAIFMKMPRLASIVAGIVCMNIWVVLTTQPGLFGAPISEWFEAIVPLSLAGVIVGYLGGALVASVFLVMEKLVKLFQRLDRSGRSLDENIER